MSTLTPIKIDELKSKIPAKDYSEFKKLSLNDNLFIVENKNEEIPVNDDIIDLEIVLRKGKRIGFFKNL